MVTYGQRSESYQTLSKKMFSIKIQFIYMQEFRSETYWRRQYLFLLLESKN